MTDIVLFSDIIIHPLFLGGSERRTSTPTISDKKSVYSIIPTYYAILSEVSHYYAISYFLPQIRGIFLRESFDDHPARTSDRFTFLLPRTAVDDATVCRATGGGRRPPVDGRLRSINQIPVFIIYLLSSPRVGAEAVPGASAAGR